MDSSSGKLARDSESSHTDSVFGSVLASVARGGEATRSSATAADARLLFLARCRGGGAERGGGGKEAEFERWRLAGGASVESREDRGCEKTIFTKSHLHTIPTSNIMFSYMYIMKVL
jgi:hypothetical protein